MTVPRLAGFDSELLTRADAFYPSSLMGSFGIDGRLLATELSPVHSLTSSIYPWSEYVEYSLNSSTSPLNALTLSSSSSIEYSLASSGSPSGVNVSSA